MELKFRITASKYDRQEKVHNNFFFFFDNVLVLNWRVLMCTYTLCHMCTQTHIHAGSYVLMSGLTHIYAYKFHVHMLGCYKYSVKVKMVVLI